MQKFKLPAMLMATVMTVSGFSALVFADDEYITSGGADSVWYSYTLDKEGTLTVTWKQDFGDHLCLDKVGEEYLDQVKKVVIDITKLNNDSQGLFVDGFGCSPDALEFTYDQDSKSIKYITIANFDNISGKDNDLSFKEGTTITTCDIRDMFYIEDLSFLSTYEVEELVLTVDLASVKMPSGIKRLNKDSIFNCYYMESVYIPASVEYIDSSAFTGCSVLSDIYFEGSEEQWNSACEELDEEVTIHFDYKPGWYRYGDGTWSYVEENLDEATGWKKAGNSWYFFDAEGKMLTGWQKDEGKWYYLDPTSGAMKTGWLKDGSKWYFLKANGEMATGWEFTGNQYNLFDNSGAMKTGWLEFESTWYYWDSEGKLVSGWLNDNGKWYYLYPELAWELQTIDGVDYYFDETSGAMVTGWRKIDGEWYYFKSSGAMQTGWVKDGDTYYYFDDSGVMQTGWVNDGGTWYYLKSNGAMAAGEYCEGYWLDTNGKWTYQYKFTWKQDSTGWYYIATNGWYVKEDTVTIDGTSYEFDGSGYIKE